MDSFETLKAIVGVILIGTGVFDAWKYSLQALKIQHAKSARTQSRKFVLMAIGNDLVRTLYGVLLLDIYIILSGLLALVCMLHLWIVVYIYYNYKQRGLQNFRRPNIFVFTWNACVPNNLRERL